MKKYLISIIMVSVITLIFSFIAANSIYTAKAEETSIIPAVTENIDCAAVAKEDAAKLSEQEKAYCGAYGLNDLVSITIKYAKSILSIVGGLALLMFIYGGIMFLISGGSAEKVTQAKQILLGAIIGIIIVFTSFAIISFVYKALGIEGNWYEIGGIWK